MEPNQLDNQPPAGFTEDVTPSSVAASEPPQGFTEDVSGAQSAGPPPGFTEDVTMPGILKATQQGLRAGFEQTAQTGEVAAGNANPQPLQETSPAAASFNMSDLTSPLSSGLPKLAYRAAESYPMLAGAVAGGATTAAIAPEIPGSSIPGMIMGTMGGAAVQTLGPAFARRIQENPNDPEAAWNAAVDDTAKAGGFAGAGAGLLELKLAGGPIKNFLFQTFGIQPGVMVAQKAEQNISEGKPAMAGTGQTYIEGSVFGAGLAGAHKGLELSARAGGAAADAMRPGVDVQLPPPAGFTEDVTPPGQGPGGGESSPSPPMPMTPGDYGTPQGGVPDQQALRDYPIGFWKNLRHPLEPRPSVSPPPETENYTESARQLSSLNEGVHNKGYAEAPPVNDLQPGLNPQDQGYLDATMSQRKPDLSVVPKLEAVDFHAKAKTLGLKVAETRDTLWLTDKAGKPIGRFYWRDTLAGPQFGNVSIDENYRRQGLTTAAQRYLEAKTGRAMIPDFTLSNAEYARWQKVNPEAVKDYKKLDNNFWSLGRGLGGFDPGAQFAFPNPLGALRRKITGPDRSGQDNIDRPSDPRITDPAEASTVLGPAVSRASWKRFDYHDKIKLGDIAEERSPFRWMLDGDPTRLLSNTDLETALALRGNGPKPDIRGVDIRSLDPASITAELHDLPSSNDPRVNLGQVTPIEYDLMRATGTHSPELMRAAYMKQVEEKGLRVAPSVGSSFMYGDVPKRVIPDKSGISYTPSTARSPLYIQDAQNTVLKPTPANVMPGVDHPGAGYRTVDMSMVPEGTFISGDSGRSLFLKYPDHFTESQQDTAEQYWRQAADMGSSAMLKELYKQGIYAEPQFTPDGKQARDRMLVAVKEIPGKAIVPGYAVVKDRLEHPSLEPVSTGKVVVDTSRLSGLSSPVAKMWDKHFVDNAKEIAGYLQEIKPVVENLLKRLGAKNVPDWVVNAGSTESPYVVVETGKIAFPSELAEFTTARFFGSLRDSVYQIVMHEVGHLVTLRSWDRVPIDVKRAVEQSWERARLKYNITNDPSSIMSVFSDRMGDFSNPQRAGYYLSFSEWHAEQFRRWMNGDPMVLSDADRYFQSGAKILQDYWDLASKVLPPGASKQMFTADYGFHSYMDYLEAHKHEGILQFSVAKLKVEMERPTSTAEYDKVEAMARDTIKRLDYLIPKHVSTVLDRTPQSRPDASWGAYNDQAKILRLFVGSLAWIKGDLSRQVAMNTALIHEAWHSVERWIKPEDRAMLLKEAKASGVLPRNLEGWYYKTYRDAYLKFGADQGFAESEARRLTENEHIASMIEEFRYGKRFEAGANGFMQKLSDFFERIGNMLMGNGFKTVDDIMHSFYRGEITDRINRLQKRQQGIDRAKALEQPAARDWKNPRNEVTTAKGVKVWKSSDSSSSSFDTTYHTFYDEKGHVAGHLDIDSKGEIQMIYTSPKFRGSGLSEAMLHSVETERGEPFKTAQMLTREGYNFLRRRAPDRVKYYVKSPKDNLFYSPKMIWEMLDSNKRDLANPELTDTGKQFAREGVKYWGDLAAKIPDGAKEDPALANQWAGRTAMMDEWERDAQTRNRDFAYQLTGRDTGAPLQDDFSATQRLQEHAWKDKTGIVPEPELLAVNGIWRKYGEANRRTNQALTGSSTERDKTYTAIMPHWIPVLGNKMISLGKQALMIRQLAWKNPHIPELQEYISYRDQQNARVQAGVRIADETLRKWDSLPDLQRDAVSELQFWATEMRYRSAQEIRNKVVRQPTMAEITTEARRLGTTRKGLDVFLRTQRDFANFLRDMEGVFTAQIQRRITDPAKAAIEVAKLRADMVELRRKPYFPMTRFGKYTVTARDPNGKVVFFSMYASAAERDAAAQQVNRANGGLAKVSTSIVPEQVMDFMGMPGPMLDRIKQDMQPALNAQQIDWIERFSQLMAPEQSFKKRWLARKGTPGYSLDGVRAYAHYFRSGTRYLARLEFMDQIKETQRRLDQSVKGARDGTSRQIIADMVNEHAKDMDAPGKEWGALKAFFTNFYLGFNVKSAFMNMTQVPIVTYPHLASVFGEKAIYDIAKASTAIRRSFSTTPQFKSAFLKAANEEMVAQGRIDIGQATELGIYANSDRMARSYMGSKAQKALRDFSWYSMYMFGKTERASREWAFDAAMELAMKNPSNRQVVDLALQKNMDLLDLIARKGWTHEQAQAFIFARETIDKTQFMYQSWDKPKFLRGKLGSSSRIFFTYTQQMLMAMTHSNPMRLRMMIMMGLLYGATGMPGAEDINSTVRALAKFLFGKDYNPEAEARKYLREWTQGTMFDEIGPDLFLHGISRYSMGTAWMANEFQGWPQFDLSGSGSMGSIIPGYKELMDGYATSGADPQHWQDTTSKVLQRFGGPAFGMFFPMMQYMNAAPYSGDQKKWEALLPTAAKNALQWGRVASDAISNGTGVGAVQNSAGADIAKFDLRDPNDRMTVIAGMLGFRPRVMSELSEANQLQKDTDTYYKAQQLDLKIQLELGIQRESKEDIQAAVDGITAYNKQVVKDGRPEYSMKAQDLLRSIREREKNNARTEAGLPQSNQQIPLQRETRQQFPGLLDSRNVK